jgi:hypothetical protein
MLKLFYDRWSVVQSVLASGYHLGPAHRNVNRNFGFEQSYKKDQM